MNRILLCISCALLITGCGIKRPLVAPKDIPAYEQKQREKLEKKRRFEEEEMRLQQQNATSPSI
jgi:predicted small lipoprotein YifL